MVEVVPRVLAKTPETRHARPPAVHKVPGARSAESRLASVSRRVFALQSCRSFERVARVLIARTVLKLRKAGTSTRDDSSLEVEAVMSRLSRRLGVAASNN
jgi:hypothetical protein